ncbi:hypothetical protein PORY_002720 [Pneumocystis oryctolagi]|uniref:Uncharacterized protein n=1 Tax=Pneumocystis oryctolagi TaxID=42067 RepID=A0ACB7C8Q0_9ASCO|nr:hypothetical protein PORY_002720 [Pneumocystis oryctolagi]
MSERADTSDDTTNVIEESAKQNTEESIVNSNTLNESEKEEKPIESSEQDSNTSLKTQTVQETNPSPVTVFHDSKNFTVKHPLMHKWTLWFTKPLTPGQRANTTDAWADSLKEVITFDSVEEFWGIYNNIAKASQLPPKSDYHLFKTGVRPEWEDKQNQRGGRWSYNNRDRRSVNIDELWLHIMLAAIGETLENEGDNEVMGVVVNIRKGFVRLGLWTRSTSNEEVLRAIGKRFREAMRIPDKETVEFYSHSDSAHSGSTRAKSRMYA